MSRERWLAVVGVGEDGDRRPLSCRAAARRASGVRGRRQAPPRARRTVDRRDARLAVADRERARRDRGASRRVRLRARERRSVLLRRRRHADAPLRRRRNDLRPGAVRLCARRGAARLEPAGLRAAHRCTAGRSRRSFRICNPAREFSRSPGTTRPRPSWRRCSRRAAWDDRNSRSAKRWAARASAFATTQAQGFALENVAALEHDRARSRRRSRRARSAARAPACRTTGSSTTGRSPSARSAR